MGGKMEEPKHVQTAEPDHKRPIAITIICIIGFLGTVVAVPLVFSSVAAGIAPWYPPYLAVSIVIGLGCMVGLWLMRKLAAYAYAAFVALNQVTLFSTGLWNPLTLLIPGVVIVVMFIYLPKMR
jgi:hypothetical protein